MKLGSGLNQRQLAKLLETAKDTPYYPIYYTAINTGLRQSELLGLRWRDIDLDLAALSVNQVLYKRRRVCIFKEPKSEHSRRRLDLLPSLSLYLRTYRAQKEAEYAALGKTLGDDDLVFSRIDGTAVDPGTLTHHFAAMVRKLGFSRVRFHDLRHSFASLMLLAGVHPKVVSEMLGNDARLLTEGEEIKSHDLFTRLTSRKTITGEDEDEESELKYLQVIRSIRDNAPDLFEKIKRLPKKARTARIDESEGNSLLTYFRSCIKISPKTRFLIQALSGGIISLKASETM